MRAGQEPQIILSAAAVLPFTDEETEAQKRLSNLFKVTWLISSMAGTGTQAFVLASS